MPETASHIRAQIEGRGFGEPMKRALRRALEGESYRAAAKAEGIDHADVFKAAKSIDGFLAAHLEAWRDELGQAMPSAWRHHLKRIEPAAPIRKAG